MNAGGTGRAASPRRYDRIVVGSSPIALIEAIYLGLKGHSCLVVDRAETIGGAWALTDLPHYSNVELGPHYAAATPAVHDFLNLLGVELEWVTPRERWFLRDRFLGMDHVTYDRRWIGSISHTYFDGSPGHRVKVLLLFAWRWALTELNPFATKRYMKMPPHGVPAMMSRLATLVEFAGVDLLLGRELTDIRIDTKRDSAVAVVDGEPIACGKVILTSASRLSSLTVDGRDVALPKPTPVRLLQLRLVLDDPNPRAFSILKFPKGEFVIDYATDVTAHVVPRPVTPEHGRVVLARIQPDLPQTEDTVRTIVHILQARGFLGREARVLWHGWHASDRPSRSEADWNRLAADNGDKIRAMYTASLGVALGKYEPRWRPVFEAQLASARSAPDIALRVRPNMS